MDEELSGDLLAYVRDLVAKKILGDIILSENSSRALKKWRLIFEVSQKELSEKMNISPSVLSDYERGRRKNPGTKFIKNFVKALVEIDMDRGGKKVSELSRTEQPPPGIILAMKELSVPVKIKTLFNVTNSFSLIDTPNLEEYIFGYTVVDSIRAILYFEGVEFMKLFGSTAKRALIFTNVTHGRSPLVAVRIYPFKPSAVIIHGPSRLDPVAIEIAKKDNLPLGLSSMPTVRDLLIALEDLEIIEKTKESSYQEKIESKEEV